jgi:glycosyltransferase involved in cell wall biosynthesis
MSIADGIRQIVEDSALRERLRTLGLARATNITWERSSKETRKVLSRFL